MEIDTGASVSIVSEETFNKIQEGQSKLELKPVAEVADVHWGADSCARLYTGCGGARRTDSLPATHRHARQRTNLTWSRLVVDSQTGLEKLVQDRNRNEAYTAEGTGREESFLSQAWEDWLWWKQRYIPAPMHNHSSTASDLFICTSRQGR